MEDKVAALALLIYDINDKIEGNGAKSIHNSERKNSPEKE